MMVCKGACSKDGKIPDGKRPFSVRDFFPPEKSRLLIRTEENWTGKLENTMALPECAMVEFS